jgi:magnesium and cobalt transporter
MVELIRPGPDSTAELIETLAEAEDKQVIGAESRFMLEGVLRMADMTAGDAMIPAPRIDAVDTRVFRCTKASGKTSSASCLPRTC